MHADAFTPDQGWRFDHLSVNAPPVQDTAIDALIGIFDLKPGHRPPFPFPGRWFYHEDDAILHVIDDPALSTARLNHIAFRSDAPLCDVMARVMETGHPHRIVRIPESQIAQIFVQITDDLLIELDVPIRSDDPS